VPFNGTNLTVTLANPPVDACPFAIVNLSTSSTLVTNLNGRNFNGSATAPTALPVQSGSDASGMTVWTDGTNYAGYKMTTGATGPTGPAGPAGPTGGGYLYSSGPLAAITTLPLPANTLLWDSGPLPILPAGKCLEWDVLVTSSTGSVGNTFKIWYGTAAATGDNSSLYTSANPPPFHLNGVICNNPGVQNAQTTALQASGNGGAPLIIAVGTGTQVTTAANLHVSVTNASNNGGGNITTTPIFFKVWGGQ
jgi:hypothetical protein